MSRIKIDDLKIDFEELKKKDPQILEKIKGGYYRKRPPGPIVIQGPFDTKDCFTRYTCW